MKYYSNESRTVVQQEGGGLLNDVINKLPFEVHLPGYNFCGPGTKLQERLARGDKGINQLDEACKEHDIAYSTHKDLPDRHQADKILLKNALSRINAKDASWKEKLAAIGVSAAMNTKLKSGMGSSSRRGRDTNQNKINDNYKNIQYNKKSTKSMNYPAVKQTTGVIKQSITTMQHYLTKMETLLGKINGSVPATQKKTTKKKSTTTITKKRKIKKPQSDGEEEEEKHIDNYHEREIKKKIANRLSAAATALPVKRKRKHENNQNTEVEVVEKRFKRDMQQRQKQTPKRSINDRKRKRINIVEEPSRKIVNLQKRKRSDDEDEEEDNDLGSLNKKIKL